MQKLVIHNQYIGTHREIACFVEGEQFQIISYYIDNLMKQFESNFSRFREDSLISELNRNRVLSSDNKDLFAMLQIGELYRTLSSGYFSIFVGSDLERLGYGKGEKQNNPLRDKECGIFLWDHTVQLHWNKNIDLGGIWKWYLIQLIKRYFESMWIYRYCINWWGDIAISQESIQDFGPLLLQHPLYTDEYFMSLNVLSGALAWSGNMYRTWKDDTWNVVWHLIDPITWEPAHTGVISAHVYHNDPLIADILATTFFVMPLEKIDELAKLVGVEYCLVLDDLRFIKSMGFC